jgi:hypothetical protein
VRKEANTKILELAKKSLFERFEKLQNLDYSKLSFTEREILTGNLGLLKQIENSVVEKDKEIERLTFLFKVLDDYLNQESPDPGQEKCERCSMNIKKYCTGDCYLSISNLVNEALNKKRDTVVENIIIERRKEEE